MWSVSLTPARRKRLVSGCTEEGSGLLLIMVRIGMLPDSETVTRAGALLHGSGLTEGVEGGGRVET